MNFSVDDLSHIAQNILDEAKKRASKSHATLITFSGDLGAGKTTMIQEIAKQLGVKETLQSPTFVIYKVYDLTPSPSPARRGELLLTDSDILLHQGTSEGPLLAGEGGTAKPPGEVWSKLIHGDMYRLESSDEIKLLGWEQLLADPENIICIEWPEKIEDAVPDWASRVTLAHQGEDLRSFDMEHKV